MPSLAELGQKVKAKYPGAYDHLDDTDLGSRVVAKYPVYGQQFSDAAKPALPAELRSGNPTSIKDAGERQQAAGNPFYHDVVPAMANRPIKGAADALEYGGKLLSPLLAPAAFVNPIGTTAGLAGGYGASRLGQSAAERFGASPDVARLSGDLAGLAGGGLLAKGATSLSRAAAPSIAESSLGVRSRDRQFGSTPGLAALKETSGFTPTQVSRSASARISSITPVMEKTVELGGPVDTTKALGAIRGARSLAATQGDLSSFNELGPMEESLTKNRVTGEPYPPLMPARNALELKRGFGREQADFNRLPGRTSLATKTARSAYGALANSIHEAAPGSNELDERVQGLIPVRDRADMKSLSADGVERTIDRATRPTGGFLPAIFGFSRAGLPGAAEALGAQEMFSSPTAKMAIARGLWRGAGGERLPVPSMPQLPQPRGLLTAGPLVTPAPEDASFVRGTSAQPPFRTGFPAKSPLQLPAPSNQIGVSGVTVPDILDRSTRGQGTPVPLLRAPENGTPGLNPIRPDVDREILGTNPPEVVSPRWKAVINKYGLKRSDQ